jgi:prevent-host-death family protein
MTTTTVSSRQFNQDLSSAKRAALAGPVIITDRGEHAHVLLSIAEYRKLTSSLPGKEKSILELLAMPGDEDIEVDPPRLTDLARGADFS